MKYLVTGGAGFIGSHIVDRLLKSKNKVVVYDNFSTGKLLFIKDYLKNPNFHLIKADLRSKSTLNQSMKGVDMVFHLAAHADVRSGVNDHEIDHVQNLEMTRNVLEAMFQNGVKKIVFSSTSSVYGDALIHPTPEEYPFQPTSLYGATKAACESYIQAYANYYDWDAYIFRFVSFVGERYTHGIIFDLLKKLNQNKTTVELLSDGTPRKSSIYVEDGVDAIFFVIDKAKSRINIYNIGQDYFLSVNKIVDIILEEAGYSQAGRIWLGTDSNWKGDNTFVQLSTEKLKKLGWRAKTPIEDGIKKTVKYLIENPKLLK